MSQLARPRGFRTGIAVGAAIALLGVAIGISAASIPSANGSIYACVTASTGALRVINYPSRHCSSTEKLLRWNQADAPGTVQLSALEGTACSVATKQAVLHTHVDPASGVVTLRCDSTLRVDGPVVMSKIVLSSVSAGSSKECHNAKACSLELPFGTLDGVAELYSDAAFEYQCPGATRQGSYVDVTRTIFQAQCSSVTLTGDKTVLTFAG